MNIVLFCKQRETAHKGHNFRLPWLVFIYISDCIWNLDVFANEYYAEKDKITLLRVTGNYASQWRKLVLFLYPEAQENDLKSHTIH